MDTQIALLLGTVLAALVFFSLERIPTDVTALGVLLFLILAGLLPSEEAFAGFGSDVVIMMLGLLILMAALSRTGVTNIVGGVILRRSNLNARRALWVVMLAAVMIGGFMSNTAATAFFLPVVIGLARNARASPAKFLMPLAFASILASSITLIGTSTNIVVSGLMSQYGLAPLSMFELTPVGLPIAVAGVVYMLGLGHRFIPDRIPKDGIETLSQDLYLTEVLVPPGSSLVGKTLQGSRLGQDLDLKVLRIVRDGRRYIRPQANTQVKAGDVLLVEGRREDILRVREVREVEIKADAKFSLAELSTEGAIVADVIAVPGSPLIGRTLRGLDFRNRYELSVLAVDRRGETILRKLSGVRLRTADILVVQGNETQLERLEQEGLFKILSSTDKKLPNKKRAPVAVAIFGGALVVAAFNLLSLPVAMLLGALLTFATRCITPEEAYRQVNWTVLILIACMLGLGRAMAFTGTASYLADQTVKLVGHSHPFWILSGFWALTVLLTQPMSNQAAAAVVLPIAIQTARQLGLNPRSFALIIALAASCSFLTPLEPACLLVYGPGRYRFTDFLRVGALLTALVYVISIVLVMLIWKP